MGIFNKDISGFFMQGAGKLFRLGLFYLKYIQEKFLDLESASLNNDCNFPLTSLLYLPCLAAHLSKIHLEKTF